MPYRTFEPIKIEKISLWRKYNDSLGSVLFSIFVGVLVIFLFLITRIRSSYSPEKELECHDSVTNDVSLRCEHKDHILSISGNNKVCSCPRSK